MNTLSALNDSSYGVTALQSQSGFVAPVSESQNGTAVPAVQEAENGYEHSGSDHENDLFSANRRTALQAYLSYGKSAYSNGITDTANTSAPISDEASADAAEETGESSSADEAYDPTVKRGADGEALSESESAEVEELEERDAEVKTHERAHQAAGGQYAGAPVYEYERGPDGKDYATEGHVDIDVSEESTPQETLQKMQQVMTAARAPAEPSSQDLKVAAEANRMAAQARAEIAAGEGDGESTEDTEKADDTESQDSSAGATKSTGSDDSKNGEQTSGVKDSGGSANEVKADGASKADDVVTPSSLTDMSKSLESILAS